MTNNLRYAVAKARSILENELVPKVPGFSIAVAEQNDIVWLQCYGFSDLNSRTAVQLSTRFRIGSVSKPFTAAALALLMERREIDIDESIQTYLPDFPNKGAKITIRMLAGHLSGFRNYRRNEALSKTPYACLRAGLKMFENDPLESQPGSRFAYSSFNWNVIGAIIESATQKSFFTFLHQNILSPLKLDNTVPELAGSENYNITKFYESAETESGFVSAPAVDNSYKLPSGGLISTVEDMVRFGQAHFQPGLLRSQSLDLLFTSQMTSLGVSTGYGVGWNIQGDWAFHAGGAFGGTSILMLNRRFNVAAAITCNCSWFLLLAAMSRSGIQPKANRYFDIQAIAYRVLGAFLGI